MSGLSKSQSDASVPAFSADDIDITKINKLRVGKYKLTSQAKPTTFVYIPSVILEQPNFTFDDVFRALDIDLPQLLLQVNKAITVEKWNLKIPSTRQKLYDIALRQQDEASLDPALEHYFGVLRENCKRLLRGISDACVQAKAFYRVVGTWNDRVPFDVVANWIRSSREIPLLAVIGCAELDEEIFLDMISKTMSATTDSDELQELLLASKIDTEPWFNGTKKPVQDGGMVKHSIPHPDATHLIISDNDVLLNLRLRESIPSGLVLVNGAQPIAVSMFCEAIQNGSPIFAFKNTGGACDLIAQFMDYVTVYRDQKRFNPTARPNMPFNPELLSDGYQLPWWIKKLSPPLLQSCKDLNILIENFPDRFNPDSVLLIDMFNTSEDKMQDKLTKTMSTVFEGVVEMGGSSSDSKRIVYAWQLRLLLLYNAKIQRLYSDVLWAGIVLFTMGATIAPVTYEYISPSNCQNPTDNGQNPAASNALLKLCLCLPLVATVLRGAFSLLNPEAKWAALQSAALSVESEIYMYRTKVGRYSTLKKKVVAPTATVGDKEKKGDDDVSGGVSGNPRQAFSAALDAVWVELSSSDIQRDSLREPPASVSILDDIHERIHSNELSQKNLVTAVVAPSKFFRKYESASDDTPSANSADTLSPLSSSSGASFARGSISPSDRVQQSNEPFDDGSVVVDINSASQRVEMATIYPLRVSTAAPRMSAANGGLSEVPPSPEQQQQPQQENREQEQCTTYSDEDGLSSLTADDYVKVRLVPILAHYSAICPPVSNFVTVAAVAIIALSIVSSAMAPFGQAVFIPMVLAVSAGISSWATHKQGDARLQLLNFAVHRLHKLIIWWNGLTIIEKRVNSNKENLVLSVEEIILESNAFMVVRKASKSQDDDEDK